MNTQQHKILIVDDQELMRRSIGSELEKNNFTVIYGEDGEMGVSVALSEHPDLILLDVVMPKMTGLEAIKKIRADEWGSTVPIIFLTSQDTSEEAIQIIEKYHPSFYLLKDTFTPAEVLEKVKESLKI